MINAVVLAEPAPVGCKVGRFGEVPAEFVFRCGNDKISKVSFTDREDSEHRSPRLVKKPVERPASVFDVEIIGPLLSESTITRARNGRPEYNLAQDA
jgi:hypothetical protein